MDKYNLDFDMENDFKYTKNNKISISNSSGQKNRNQVWKDSNESHT
jgi:hypothetical protein